ncbi:MULTISPECIES: NADPH-dependent F420 reductase [unclassified Paenibacillus]|uniref:NADPH-dependent F420 reductase n=1 Tax=unclassified Paenibacillus TaxID=185978 RepID=UPI00070B34D6|nr:MULTISPECIES: NADPH-dependent F420 reductase [unclassified Paenibacillus]KQX51225.1 NADP oxidoreductase [Paenibacillus sp. Root444D2]KRE44256.1 NADP oxidoreductase [Paenibacillus sp. Soil724D2]
MTIGIIGAGRVGRAFATKLVQAGYDVVISNKSGPEALEPFVNKLGKGIKAGTIEEAARAKIVMVAIPWIKLEELLSKLPNWEGRIVIDANNAFLTYAPDYQVADLGRRTSSEIFAEWAPGARIVKAFNTLFADYIEENPMVGPGRRVLFYSGNDKDAKQELGQLFEELGFAPIDLGDLATGGRMQQLGSPLAGLNLLRL